MTKQHVLLAYGKKEFSLQLKKVLEQKGYAVTLLYKGAPPKGKYNIIVQLGRNPADLAEWTRDLLNKTAHDQARFFLVRFRTDERLYEEASHFAQSLTQEFERRSGTAVTILNLAQIYGPRTSEKDAGAVGHLIKEFAEGEFLTLYGEGKDSDYYLYRDDALEGIAAAIETGKSGEAYAISPTVPTSSAAAAKLLFELGGGRHEIRFHRGLTALKEKKKVEGKILPNFKPHTSFRKGILAVLKDRTNLKKAQLPRPKAPLLKINFKFKKPSRRGILITAAVLLLLSPLLYFGGGTALALSHLNKTKNALLRLDFETAQRSAAAAANDFKRLEKIIPIARAGTEVSSAIAEVSAQGNTLNTIIENLSRSYRGESVQPQNREELRALSRSLNRGEENLLLAWVEISQADQPWRKYLSPLKPKLEESLKVIRTAAAFAAQAEGLLGYNGERIYLILFQNSAELRAGGGFLGSLAQLTLSNGGIKEWQFFDSYQFDYQADLSSQPAFLKFRGRDKIPLREANFPASFPQSAKDIATLFESAQGVEVDGVVGTTLPLAQDFLKVTGELDLSEFGRKINAENLFTATTQEVEKDFFPGSTKKKRFLQALGEALLGRVFSLDKNSYSALGKTVWRSLEERSLLLYFKRGVLAQALQEAGWDGRVSSKDGDYLLVLDSNYGTKVNELWVRRSSTYRVFSPDRSDRLKAELTIKWEHTGTEAWPSGTYRNLLRILGPKGAQLTGAELNGKNYDAGIFSSEEAGKTEFAAYLSIAPQTTVTLKLTYQLPNELNIDGGRPYRLHVQKQPGTLGDLFTFIFEEPFGQAADGEGLRKVDNRLIFEGKLEQDLSFEIIIK